MEQIRDQIIEKCAFNLLRRKLLEKGRTLNLQQLRDIARALEDSERQARSIEGICENVNNISVEKFAQNKPKRKGKGKQGKFKHDVTC